MLSTANPVDTPCSSRAPPPPLNAADEKNSDQLPFQEADPAVGLLVHTQQQTPNFSIRDHVFASRIDGVETNWPFPEKLLQLCLKHGVRDPLPPFEPPDLVRSRCRGEEVYSEAGRAVVAPVVLHETRDVCSNCVEPVSLLPSDDKVIGPPQEKLEASQELSRKKYKLVLKVSTAISQSKLPPEDKDIASTSSTISDPMASKVCPVCKLFVSSSNTTMNVHMDQCLRMESDSTKLGDMTKPSNLKSKPRKKRLMVDIYATAPYCTLEDLDRRNGTTWARDLAVVAPTAGKPPTETRRPMLSQVDIRHDGDEAAHVEPPTETKRPRLVSMGVRHDGDESVYVDSNGIKLRILSKLTDKPVMIPGEESKLSKHAMEPEFNEGKGVLFSEKKQFGSKLLKNMKAKPLSKKLSSFEIPRKEEIQAPPAKDYHAVETRRESEEANLPLAAGNMQSSGRATLGKWVCSKRSDLPKKKKKAILKCSENIKLTCKGPSLQSHVSSSWSTEDLRSSPKTKRVDSLQTKSNEKNGSPNPGSSTLANGPRLKVLSRSCGTSLSSRRSTGEEHPSSTRKSDNPHHATARSSDSGHTSMKSKKIVSLKKNILARRPSSPLQAVNDDDDDTGKRIPKTFRKRRSVLLSSRHGGEVASDATGTSKKVRTHRSNFSSSTLRSRIGESMEWMLLSGRNLTESGKEEEVIPMEEPGHSTPEQEPLEVECQDIRFTCGSMDEVYDDHVICSNRISEHLATNFTTDHADPKPFGDEYAQSVSGSESHEEQAAPRVYDKKEIQSFDVQMADEVAIRGEGKSQVVQSLTETVSAQESSACLTSHGEVGLDVPPENSSVTSCQVKSDQYQTPALDREPSFSPGSTASTVSTPPHEVYRPKGSKAELTARPECTGEARVRAIEMRNEEIEMISQTKEPEQVSDGQGCCCSRREGISREFPFMRQNSVVPATTTVVPSRGKQISALCIAPPRLSSFVSYPGLRTESPTELTKLSPKSAAMKFPAYSGLGSNSASSPYQTPPTPNSVLRLMGKDLMVLKEESTRPSNPQPSPSENSFPHLGVAPAPSGSTQESYWYSYSPQLQNGPSAFGQVFPVDNHQFPLHSKRVNKKPNSPVMNSAHRQQQNTMKEVIVIDDSPDTEPEMVDTLPMIAVPNPIAQQRQLARFPSHTQYISRDVSGGFRPVYLKPGPRELQANTVKSTEDLRPLLPNPFYFHSTSTGQLLGKPVYTTTLKTCEKSFLNFKRK